MVDHCHVLWSHLAFLGAVYAIFFSVPFWALLSTAIAFVAIVVGRVMRFCPPFSDVVPCLWRRYAEGSLGKCATGFLLFFFCSGPLPVMSLLCLGVVRVLTFVLVSRWWKYEKISTRYRPMSKKSRRSTALFYQRRKRMKVCRSTVHLLLLGNLNLVSFHCRGQART